METDTAFTSFIVIKTASGRSVSMSINLLTIAINSPSIGRNSKLMQISYMHTHVTNVIPYVCIGTCMGTGVPEKNQPGRGNAKRRRRRSRGETRLIDTLISSNCGIIARRFLPICNPPRAIVAHLSTLFRTCKNIINERAGGARAIPPDCEDFILHASASVVTVYLATLPPLSVVKAFLFLCTT